MSVIPTKPGDRMAASAWTSKTPEQQEGAGDAFAALFGAAWTQQMQQTRAAQDQRMAADTGGSPVAETARRNDDAQSRQTPIANRASSQTQGGNRTSEDGAEIQGNVEARQAVTSGRDADTQKSDGSRREGDKQNAASDAALARRLARQQRPGSQTSQAAQAAQNAQQAATLASSAGIAADTAHAVEASAKGKGKRVTAGEADTTDAASRLGLQNTDNTAGDAALLTQRAVAQADAAAGADAMATASAGAQNMAADASASSTDALSAGSSRGQDLKALQAGMATENAAKAASASGADQAAGKASSTLLEDGFSSALNNASAQQQDSADSPLATGGTNAADAAQAALSQSVQRTAANAEAMTDARLKTGAQGKDSGAKQAALADAALSFNTGIKATAADTASLAANAAANAATTAGNKTANSNSGDALRTNMAAADASAIQAKPLDPRNGAAVENATGTANNASAASATSNAAFAGADKTTAANAGINTGATAQSDAANAARKGDDVKAAPAGAASGRNRSAAATNAASASAGAMTAAGDAKAAADASTISGSTTANAMNPGTAMAQTPASIPGGNGNSAAQAQGGEAASASSTSASNPSNGAQLSAAALDGLNAFQRVAAQDDAPRLVMSTPITEPGFADELHDTVKLVSTRGLQSVEINIAPAELGPIKLRVDMTGNEADVRFEAAHETTRNLLADAVPALKEQLAQSGIDLRHASIDRNNAWNGNAQGNPQQTGQNMGQGSGQQSNNSGNNGGNGRFDGSNGSNGRGGDATAQAPAQRIRNALLDTYA